MPVHGTLPFISTNDEGGRQWARRPRPRGLWTAAPAMPCRRRRRSSDHMQGALRVHQVCMPGDVALVVRLAGRKCQTLQVVSVSVECRSDLGYGP